MEGYYYKQAKTCVKVEVAQIPICETLLSIRASLDNKRCSTLTYLDCILLPSGCRSLQDLDPLLSFTEACTLIVVLCSC